jgi:hypothetical protein
MTATPIRPFTVTTPQEDLDDLRDRLERTRFAPTVPGDDWTYGTPTAYLQDMVATSSPRSTARRSTSSTSGRPRRTRPRCCSRTPTPARSWSSST